MIAPPSLYRRFASGAIRSKPLLLQARSQSSKHGARSATANEPTGSTQHHSGYSGIRGVIRLGILCTGILLGGHIFVEYFFSLGESYGISMLPTLNSTGDWLIMSKYYRRGRKVEVGDLVSFKHPISEDTRSVKRVLGMPGDFVLWNTPNTNDLMIQVPQGHCYVVGDNLEYSRDSRHFGPLPLALVKSRVIGRLTFQKPWPEFFERGLKPPALDDDEE